MYETPQKIRYNISKIPVTGNYRISFLERQDNSIKSNWVTIGYRDTFDEAQFLVKKHSKEVENFYYDEKGDLIQTYSLNEEVSAFLKETN